MFLLPVKRFPYLYHVGTMQAQDKKSGSMEGAGLSVSLHPNEWSQIARCLSGHLFRLTKENNAFLDYYKLTSSQEQMIIDWGRTNEYILPQTLYRVQYFDDEMGSDVYSDYTDKKEALGEAESYEVDLIERNGYIATDKMKKKVWNDCPPIIVLSLLVTLYVDEATDLDGVWWEEELDVSRYSGPRGVIVPSKVEEWDNAKLDAPLSAYGWDIETVRQYCPCCETDSVEPAGEDRWQCQNPSCQCELTDGDIL